MYLAAATLTAAAAAAAATAGAAGPGAFLSPPTRGLGIRLQLHLLAVYEQSICS